MDKRVRKELVTAVFALAMVTGLIPGMTLSAEAEDYVYDVSKGSVSIAASTSDSNIGGYAVTYGGLTDPEEVPKDSAVTITGSTNSNVVTVNGVAITIIMDKVTIDRSSAASQYYSDPCAFLLENGANVTLDPEGTNTLKSGYHSAGLQVSTGNTLTIDGTGTLTAVAYSYGQVSSGAGIGGGYGCYTYDYYAGGFVMISDGSAGTICIKNGTVNATAALCSAGIGAGIGGSGGSITIEGGTVTATGGESGAGIGCGVTNGGVAVNGGNIAIKGGTVTATGGKGSAGIGGGEQSCGGTINISGGTVQAIGGAGESWGAGPGIGSAMNASGSDSITIGGSANVIAASPGSSFSTDAIRSISGAFSGTALMVTFPSQQTSKPLAIKNGTSDIGTVSPTYESVAFTAAAGNAYHLYAGSEPVFQSDGTEGFSVSGSGLTAYTDVFCKYTVSFDSNGGSGTFASQSVKPGVQAAEPADKPTRDGYNFSGWYTDRAATHKFDFSRGITDSITLYAGWSLAAPSVNGQPADVTGKTYADGSSYTLSVSASHPLSSATLSYQWYKEAEAGTASPSSDAKAGTDSSLTVSSVADSGYYYCVVSASLDGNSSSAQSSAAQVAIGNVAQAEIANDITITFSDAVSDNSGTLSGVTTAMEYSTDKGNSWTACGSNSFTVTGISASNDIWVRYAPKANYDASPSRTVDIVQAAAPDIYGVNPSTIGGKGRITGVNTTMEYKKSTDSSWTSITSELLTDSSLSDLAVDTTYDVRVKASGAVLASPAGEIAINRYDAPREDMPSASVDYVNEKLTDLSANAAYLINDALHMADADGKIGIDGGWFGKTVSIIKKGNYTTTDDSSAQSLSVDARPTAPKATKVTISYNTETINYDTAAYEVSSAETGGDTIANGSSIKSYIPAAGGSGFVYIRVKASSTSFASGWTAVTVPARPATPAASVVIINYGAETISCDSKYEVCSAASGGTAIAEGSIQSYIPAAGSPAMSIFVRTKATSTGFASEWQSVTVSARPATPSAPVLSAKTDTTVILESAEGGMEYERKGGTWQDGVSFSEFTPGAEYQFFARVKATSSSFASAVSLPLSVTTKTSAADAPSAPVVSKQLSDSISVDVKKGCQYAITAVDSEPTEEKFGPVKADDGTEEFSGLNAAARYYVWAQVAETGDAMASNAAKTSIYTAAAAPASSSVVINYDAETITYGSDCEVYTAQTGGEAVLSGGSIENRIPEAGSSSEGAVYVRVKASGSIPASEWTAVTIPVRPNAPVASAVTIDFAAETVNYASNYEVRSEQTGGTAINDKDSIKAYIPDAGKPSGVLYVRAKAVSGKSFKSVCQSLTVPARPDTPADITLNARSDMTVSLNIVAGLEYSRDGGKDWQDTGSFTGLVPNEKYTFFARVKAATGTSFASGSGNPITVKTKASAADAPHKPVLVSKTAISITVSSISGQEYSIDHGVTWQDSGKFTGLTSGTVYSVITRIKETDTAMPSKSSEALVEKTDIIVGSKGNIDNTSIIVNGKTLAVGTVETETTKSGKKVKTVTVDSSKLKDVLESEETGVIVKIPITGESDVASGVLTGEAVKNMETKDATLVVQTNSGTYTLPASEIKVDSVSKQFGTDVLLSNIKVTVSISEPSASMTHVVENAAQNDGFTIMVPAVEYTITCTHGSQTVRVSSFNAYVERTIAIPDGVDPSKITTAIVVKPDGTTHHVPTKVAVTNGKYYVVINSLTNSTYSAVWNPVEFSDVDNHWAKDAINDMGSRMVVTGIGNNNYAPDRNITRAEFAAIMVRALGLEPGTGTSGFGDVAATDWYSGYIKAATSYGIIKGYDNGSFSPNETITREQAVTMIARAMTITKLSVALSDSEADQLLSAFPDGADVSDYATGSMAACLKTGIISGTSDTTISPKADITRAEVAVMVERLLQKSNLI